MQRFNEVVYNDENLLEAGTDPVPRVEAFELGSLLVGF